MCRSDARARFAGSAEKPGARGYMQCADDGSRYGACDCSGKIPAGAGVLVDAAPPPDGAGAADAADAAPALAAFLDPCSDDAECATHLCFPFNAYGPHCSMP